MCLLKSKKAIVVTVLACCFFLSPLTLQAASYSFYGVTYDGGTVANTLGQILAFDSMIYQTSSGGNVFQEPILWKGSMSDRTNTFWFGFDIKQITNDPIQINSTYDGLNYKTTSPFIPPDYSTRGLYNFGIVHNMDAETDLYTTGKWLLRGSLYIDHVNFPGSNTMVVNGRILNLEVDNFVNSPTLSEFSNFNEADFSVTFVSPGSSGKGHDLISVLNGNDPFDYIFLNVDGTVSTSTSVPEPSTMLLFGTGLVGFVAFRRRFIK